MFPQAKKRRAEALDGIAGDVGDVCKARSESYLLLDIFTIHFDLQTDLGGYDHRLLNNSWLRQFEVGPCQRN